MTVTVLWVVGWSAVCDCCMGWSYSLFCHQPAYDYTLGLSLCQVCNYFPFTDSCSSVAYPLLIYHLCTRAGPMTVIKCVMSVQGGNHLTKEDRDVIALFCPHVWMV